MKYIYLYIFSFILFTGSLAWGQVEIYDGNTTTNVSGQTLNISLSGQTYEGYIYFKNISGREETYILTRRQLATIQLNLSEQLCFGPLAGNRNFYDVDVNSETYEFPNSLTLGNNEKGLFEFIFSEYDIPADVNYRYYIATNQGTLIDSVDVKATASLSVKELNKAVNVTVSSYPNPATNYLTVAVNGSNENTIKIIDVLGKTVYSEKIGTTKKVDVSDLNNGVYILTVTTSSGKVVQNKRIIIKH
ncbi:MAG: T9SS type A sorting domain-containing protein [Flavobacteriia bacterium]|nr:T9SS type A sorting domain-containing protein [Flavobacteriia bacterium]OJX35919.1 MAG: hypothetical protein BGO87_05455 [Flavobacteriia bacterium 40-80]